MRDTTSHAPDAGRAIIQCTACLRWARWSGEQHAWAQGWRSKYVASRRTGVDTVRVWSCSSCYAPPTSSPVTSAAPTYALPARMAEQARRHAHVVEQLVEQLLEVDRPRGQAYARQLVEAAKGTKASERWAAWLDRVLPPRVAARARRRRAA